MAATGQGQAAGGDAAQSDAQQGQAQESQGLPAELAQQLGDLTSGQQELGEWLRSEPWKATEQEGEEAQEDGELDLSFLDPSDPNWDPDAVAQRLGGLIDSAAERRAQQMRESDIDPIRSEVAEIRREREAERLVAEFPQLAEPESAREVIGVAKQLAEANGRPELQHEPWFWRLTYMAGTAAEAANEEGSESPRAAHLEGGGGAAPAGGQVDLAQQIVSPGGDLGARALPNF